MQTFPSGKDYYRLLLEKVGYNAAYHAQRILNLKAYYPDDAIEQALRHAHHLQGDLLQNSDQHPEVSGVLALLPSRRNSNTSSCSKANGPVACLLPGTAASQVEGMNDDARRLRF